MAVSQVIPGSAVQPWGGDVDEHGVRKYRESWIVVTDDANDGPVVAGNAPGVPRLYSAYQRGNDIDLGATLRSIKAERRDGSLKVFDIYLEWDSSLESADQGDRNPLARRREKKWSALSFEEPMVYDFYGNPIINTAMDEFDPPAMGHRRGLRLVYRKNLASESEVAFAYSFLDYTNQDTFQGFVPGVACCVDVEANEDFDNGIFYWPTTLTFEFRWILLNPKVRVHQVNPDGSINNQPADRIYPWDTTILNAGLYTGELLAGRGKIRIPDRDGKPAVQPMRLNLDGSAMAFNTPREQSIYLTWKKFGSKAFAPLGIT